MNATKIEQVKVFGRPMPMNIWGQTTLLLSMLYREGHLPDCSIYGKEDHDGEDQGYFINGEFVGHTLEEVTTAVWKMVACWKANGYLFDN